jgi:hypothetical protein
MRALLKFSVSVDRLGDDNPAQIDVRLYRNGCVMRWHIGNEFGEEVGVLPSPLSIKQAKKDVLAVFGGASWQLRASWL